jgi:Spy/CpxP family protein refolding chaperone
MSDSKPVTTPAPSAPTHKRSRRARRLFGLVLLLVVGGSLAATSAFADRRGGHSPEAMRGRASWAIDKMIGRIDGTDAQGKALEAIVDKHFEQAMAFRTEGRALRAKLAEALLADTVDGVKVEALRKELVALVDRGSLVVTQALTEASGTLTPEQKQQLFERFSDRFGE